MPIQVLLPALSPTMEKGNLAKWVKKEGDKVKAGDVLAEIETDKATMEYEAIDDGILAKIVVPEGTQDVPVNQLIAVLAEEGEDPRAAAATAGKGPAPKIEAPAKAQELPKPTDSAKPAAAPAPQSNDAGKAAAAVAAAPPPAAPAPAAHGTNRLFASPLARRMAKDANIELARVAGSGPHGRVIARD